MVAIKEPTRQKKVVGFLVEESEKAEKESFFHENGCHLGSRVRSEIRKESDPREKKGKKRKEKKRKERKERKTKFVFSFFFLHIFGPFTLVIKLEEDVNFRPF